MEILKEVIVRYVTDGRIVKAYDQEEIVRCKDCKYWNGSGKYCDYEMSGLEDDFCSWAERKEE